MKTNTTFFIGAVLIALSAAIFMIQVWKPAYGASVFAERSWLEDGNSDRKLADVLEERLNTHKL